MPDFNDETNHAVEGVIRSRFFEAHLQSCLIGAEIDGECSVAGSRCTQTQRGIDTI